MFVLQLLSCGILITLSQAKLAINVEDAYFEIVSPEFFNEDECEIEVNDKSDGINTLSTNIEIINQIPVETRGRMHMLGFSMGEYTEDVGIDIEMTLCDMIADPLIVGPILEMLGFNLDECPVNPGQYTKDDFFPRMDGLPDTFPSGKYKLMLVLEYENEPILKAVAFCSLD